MTGLSAVALLFNLYAEHIMRKAGLDELQAGINIGTRNTNIRKRQMVCMRNWSLFESLEQI